MFDYKGPFVSPITPARGQLFISLFTRHAYDSADVIDDDNYATVLENFLITLLWPA